MAMATTRQSFAFQDLTEVPMDLAVDTGAAVEELDLTHNRIRDLKFLIEYVNLKTLVLDHNLIGSHVKMPELPALNTIWVNSNKIDNLSLFIDTLAKKCPNLKILSMMNNEAAPSYLNNGSKQEYMDYRYYVISKLPKLEALDDKKIDDTEREEAQRIYKTRRRRKKGTE